MSKRIPIAEIAASPIEGDEHNRLMTIMTDPRFVQAMEMYLVGLKDRDNTEMREIVRLLADVADAYDASPDLIQKAIDKRREAAETFRKTGAALVPLAQMDMEV